MSAEIKAVVQLSPQVTAFGTDRGLTLWDGKTFTLFTGPVFNPLATDRRHRHGATVPGNSQLSLNNDLLVADDGKLWVGTEGGLAWYQNGSIENVTPRMPTVASFGPAGHEIQQLFRRANGQIILGTRFAGVVVYDPANDTFNLVHHTSNYNQWVSAIAEDREGTLWIAVRELGVIRYAGDEFKPLPFPAEWGAAAGVRTLCVGSDGELWIGTTHGLVARQSDGRSRLFSARDGLPADLVDKIWADRDGNIWVSGYPETAVYRRQMDLSGIRPGEPFFVEMLTGGDLWIATRKGIVRNSSIVWHAQSGMARWWAMAKKEIESQYPRVDADDAIAVDGQRRWVGDGDALTQLRRAWLDRHNGKHQSSGFHLFYQGRFQRPRLGQYIGQGLYRFDGDRADSFFNFAGKPTSVIYSMAEAKSGTVYIGAQFGFYAFEGDEPKTISTRYQVGDLVVDGLGRVWGSDVNSGLLFYDGEKVRELSTDPQLSGWRARRISLIRPDTVRVDAVVYTSTGRRRASFECDGNSIKIVAGEPLNKELW